MTTVELGTNRFIDCRTLIGFKNAELLAVLSSPLLVSLDIPESRAHNGTPVVVGSGVVEKGDGVSISSDERSCAIYFRDVLVAVALHRSLDTVHLKIDLRPFGYEIYDDVEGLHIGTNLFAHNEIRGAAVAIALAD